MSNRPTRKTPSSIRVAQAKRTASASHRTTWWIVGVVCGVVMVALLAAIVVSARSDSSSALGPIKGGGTVVPNGQLAYGDVVVRGTALAEQSSDGSTDPALGQLVPELQGEQFDGNALTIPSTGKPKVVMFVAHWCPHCQAEVPLIAKYLTDNGLPTDVDLYAVTTSTSDQRVNYPPAPWLNKAGWPVRTIADDSKNTAATAYGVGGFPFFVVVDAQGKVIDRQSGEMPIEQFQSLIAKASASSSATTGTTAPTGTAAPAT